MKKPSIMWFRQDLRITDNPALQAASADGSVIPIYILDDQSAGQWKMGAASRVWLHHSLHSLNKSLNGKLLFFTGNAQQIITTLVEVTDACAVHWNRCYEPWRIARDLEIKQKLQTEGVQAQSHNGSLLWEPWQILKKDGTPYKVFTPYFRKGCLAALPPRDPLVFQKPKLFKGSLSSITTSMSKENRPVELEHLNLLPTIEWHLSIVESWQIGEEAAREKIEHFVDASIHEYKMRRDYPASGNGSRLSPHLHFGEISPHQVWCYAQQAPAMADETNRQHFLSELGWREFSHYLLYHWPQIPDKPFKEKYDAFPWLDDTAGLTAWQKGLTGYPIVDAGMRELWQTGFMHNRVRMIVASFLVKNQLIPWQQGEAWFWDCLVDADLAANSASWQWSAGCGADAAPYFRIFNPVTQSEKFDAEGDYIRTFCPELSKLPNKYIHKPWEADEKLLLEAGVELGVDYPKPILDLKVTRERALAANRSLSAESS